MAMIEVDKKECDVNDTITVDLSMVLELAKKSINMGKYENAVSLIDYIIQQLNERKDGK